MAKHENQRGYFFMGLLMGSVLGAVAGIFFAPKSGKELRSDIKEKGSEVLRMQKKSIPTPLRKHKKSSRKPSIRRRS